MDPVKLLLFNGALQIFVSSLLGLLMVVLMQPWARNWPLQRFKSRDLMSVHLDWVMLAFMQFGAAFGLTRITTGHAALIAWLLVFGGWANAGPYLFRAFGINAFVMGGSLGQRAASSLSGLSAFSLILAWGLLVHAWWP